MRDSIRYSEAFKLKVVNEIASGKFSGYTEAARVYGIKAHATVKRWLQIYGRNDLIPKVIQVSRPEEIEEKKKLEKRVRELEKALANMTMDSLMNQAYFEIVCEENGIQDIDAKKKKVAKQLSKKSDL